MKRPNWRYVCTFDLWPTMFLKKSLCYVRVAIHMKMLHIHFSLGINQNICHKNVPVTDEEADHLIDHSDLRQVNWKRYVITQIAWVEWTDYFWERLQMVGFVFCWCRYCIFHPQQTVRMGTTIVFFFFFSYFCSIVTTTRVWWLQLMETVQSFGQWQYQKLKCFS